MLANKFEYLIENSHDALSLTSKTGEILYLSRSSKNILGYAPEDLVGKNGLSLLHPDDLKQIQKQWKDFHERPGMVAKGQVRFKHKNGQWRWLEVTSTNLLQEDEINAVVNNYRDVTDSKELEHRKDEFITITSHELKTPIAVLKGFNQILMNCLKNNDDPKLKHYLLKMDNQISRMSELVTNLLEVSRLQEHILKLEKEEFNLNSLIDEVIEDIRLTTDTHTIEFNSSEIILVSADRARIEQVLINFIFNAIKYSPQSKNIIVRSSVSDNYAIVSVQDFGIGVAKKYQELIFDRFFQVKNKIRSSFSGLGLGLYISAEIINMHKGKICVESENGVGSTFSFSLPIL